MRELLHAADEPMVLHQAAGWEFPRGFDVRAAQARFDRLGTLLSEAFGVPVGGGRGPQQDATYFGDIEIPASATRTRAKKSRGGCVLTVRVSNFANLATCLEPAHPEDQRRIEAALAGAGYAYVSRELLSEPYDGPHQWAYPQGGATWQDRFFGFV